MSPSTLAYMSDIVFTCHSSFYYTLLYLQSRCDCPAGWHGPLCQSNVDDCKGVNCHNGTCVDGVSIQCIIIIASYVVKDVDCNNGTCFSDIRILSLLMIVSCCPHNTVQFHISILPPYLMDPVLMEFHRSREGLGPPFCDL